MTSILTVDDSTSMRRMVATTLEMAGYRAVEAEDGKAALAAAQANNFSLILTDLNMPNMDGISLIRALRALPAYRFTPILMLTTESQPALKQAGREAGATGWIVKPFNPETLLATIKKVIG